MGIGHLSGHVHSSWNKDSTTLVCSLASFITNSSLRWECVGELRQAAPNAKCELFGTGAQFDGTANDLQWLG